MLWLKQYAVPARTQSAGYIRVGIVAYHKMRRGIGAARSLHCMFIKTDVGFGNTDIIAEHGEVDKRSYAGIMHLAVLNVGKIAVIAIIAMLLLMVPVLFVAVAGVSLGGVLFMLWKEHQEKQQAREEVLFGDDEE